MDGRAARGARNREAIVDAALALVGELGALPTAQAIAERAGVVTRSVFHHFPSLDSLLAEAAETQATRWWSVLQAPDATRPLKERLHEAVSQRAELFEAISDVRRVAVRHEPVSAALADRMAHSRNALRQHLRRALRPELSALDRASAAGVEAAASWEMWDLLRRQHNLSPDGAMAAVLALLEPLLLGVAVGKET